MIMKCQNLIHDAYNYGGVINYGLQQNFRCMAR